MAKDATLAEYIRAHRELNELTVQGILHELIRRGKATDATPLTDVWDACNEARQVAEVRSPETPGALDGLMRRLRERIPQG